MGYLHMVCTTYHSRVSLKRQFAAFYSLESSANFVCAQTETPEAKMTSTEL